MRKKLFLEELCNKNGDMLYPYTRPLRPNEKFEDTETVFNYSNRYGGTIDSFRYYNNYYILRGKEKKRSNKKQEMEAEIE